MISTNGSVIQIRDVSRVESAKRALRIHVHEDGERPITLQLSPSSLKKLARMLEPLIDEDGYAAQRGKRLVKLARLKETYGACLVAELLSRYPEYDLDELERDLSVIPKTYLLTFPANAWAILKYFCLLVLFLKFFCV